jgi:hypothetical protein
MVFAVLATGAATIAAVMYNLVSDVVGGVELVVLEETLGPAPQPLPPSRGRSLVRAIGQAVTGGTPSTADIPTEEAPIPVR